jgi:hypothetical protein
MTIAVCAVPSTVTLESVGLFPAMLDVPASRLSSAVYSVLMFVWAPTVLSQVRSAARPDSAPSRALLLR